MALTARVTVLVWAAILLACGAANGQGSPRAARVKVHFLATSTSVRTSEGRNEDVYLVEISLSDTHDEIALARLVDEFPSYRKALSTKMLQNDTTTVIRLRRDRNCDRAFGNMPLRTAPGDPSAILPERLGFQPQLPRPVEENEVLPCYRIERH